MLLRLAYLAATNTFALLRLLPMNDRDKDIEVLALRHQLLVLQRQVSKPTFTERLGDIALRIQTADADKKEPLYEALGITITYDNATRTATVRSRPSLPYRYSQCPRAELTADDTVVVAQAGLRLWSQS